MSWYDSFDYLNTYEYLLGIPEILVTILTAVDNLEKLAGDRIEGVPYLENIVITADSA